MRRQKVDRSAAGRSMHRSEHANMRTCGHANTLHCIDVAAPRRSQKCSVPAIWMCVWRTRPTTVLPQGATVHTNAPEARAHMRRWQTSEHAHATMAPQGLRAASSTRSEPAHTCTHVLMHTPTQSAEYCYRVCVPAVRACAVPSSCVPVNSRSNRSSNAGATVATAAAADEWQHPLTQQCQQPPQNSNRSNHCHKREFAAHSQQLPAACINCGLVCNRHIAALCQRWQQQQRWQLAARLEQQFWPVAQPRLLRCGV